MGLKEPRRPPGTGTGIIQSRVGHCLGIEYGGRVFKNEESEALAFAGGLWSGGGRLTRKGVTLSDEADLVVRAFNEFLMNRVRGESEDFQGGRAD